MGKKEMIISLLLPVFYRILFIVKEEVEKVMSFTKNGFFTSSLVLSFVLVSYPVYAAKYIANVTSIEQRIINSPRNSKKRVYEGCGPVAAAMLLGFWQTENGKKNLLSKNFRGAGGHPYNALRKLYIDLDTRRGIKKASFTMPNAMFNGLKKRVKGTGLKVKRLKKSKSWKKKKSELIKQLKKGNPVIVLKNREHKKGCLGEKSRGFNLYQNVKNAHYFLVVGYKGKKFAVMPGWRDQPKARASNFSVHTASKANTPKGKVAGDYWICSFEEMKKANPSLFWIQK